ncbi:MAG TPA: isoleucine--tRNA ligase [Planctomycetota bacterium]|nr:isoleucine--tRNA ligase [Planctomycetota bacterium]
MSVFDPVPTQYNFPLSESKVNEFWTAQQIFQKSLDWRKNAPKFVFYEGPPTANGLPHNGHVFTRAVKDLFPRYKTMRGHYVHRKAGWDTHGLPVEVEVEKDLGIHGREAIIAYGLKEFSERCQSSVFRYQTEWEHNTRRIGYWCDLDDPYVTYHKPYVESVWWALAELFKKDLLYRGHKVVWWWPQGGTALSAGEVGSNYKTVDDPSITVRFPVAGQPGVSFLAWTTTPWTLPSNCALTVHPAVDYSYCVYTPPVDKEGKQGPTETFIVADKLANAVLGENTYTKQKTVKGKALLGMKYDPIFTYEIPAGKVHVVIAGDFVTLDTGTGVVHTAPAFGEDDYRVAQAEGIAFLQLLNPDGKFKDNCGPYAGRFCKEADRDIIRELRTRGVLFDEKVYRHDYPFCWRADNDPLIQYARKSWFIRTTREIDAVLANNSATNWLPPTIRDGRFGDFLRNNVDWAISRERFWGTPLNIWECETCAKLHAPDSVAAIRKLDANAFTHWDKEKAANPALNEHLMVHKPWIDLVTFSCKATGGNCAGTMKRVPEVIDCWFDSGAMPFAQWGYPHQNQDKLKEHYPADFISEAIDQTRGWFYSQMMIANLLFKDFGPPGPRPFKNCIVLGHICDEQGYKESKSKGNYTPPSVILDKLELDLPARAGKALYVNRGTGGKTEKPVNLKAGQVALCRDVLSSIDLNPNAETTVSFGGKSVKLKVVSLSDAERKQIVLTPDDLAALGAKEGDLLKIEWDGSVPGADAFRWFFYASSPPWTNKRHSLRNVREAQREFLIKLRNVYSFFVIYANIDGFNPADAKCKAERRPAAQRSLLDRWVLSELNLSARQVCEKLDAYDIYGAATTLASLVESVSNWYVRRSRDRFWSDASAGADKVRDKFDAEWTLWEVLVTLAKLLAPFTPFMAEEIYRNLVAGPLKSAAPESVHLCDYPTGAAASDAEVDAGLAQRMALVRKAVSLGLQARSDRKIKVRQPLAHATICLNTQDEIAAVKSLEELLLDELNVQKVSYEMNADTYVNYELRPNYKLLGPKLGAQMPACKKKFGELNAAKVKTDLDRTGKLLLNLDGAALEFTTEEVQVHLVPKEGFAAAGFEGMVVVLDTQITPALAELAFAREFISKLQAMRKDAALDFTDRIRVSYQTTAEAAAIVVKHAAAIQRETLATVLASGSVEGAATKVEGYEVVLKIEKA